MASGASVSKRACIGGRIGNRLFYSHVSGQDRRVNNSVGIRPNPVPGFPPEPKPGGYRLRKPYPGKAAAWGWHRNSKIKVARGSFRGPPGEIKLAAIRIFPSQDHIAVIAATPDNGKIYRSRFHRLPPFQSSRVIAPAPLKMVKPGLPPVRT